MDKKRQGASLAGLSIVLIIAIGNYTRIPGTENIRAVEFLSIFAIGLLAGVLFTNILKIIRNRNDSK